MAEEKLVPVINDAVDGVTGDMKNNARVYFGRRLQRSGKDKLGDFVDGEMGSIVFNSIADSLERTASDFREAAAKSDAEADINRSAKAAADAAFPGVDDD